MTDIVIAGAVRTAQGKLGGALKHFTNQGLGEIVVRALIDRAHLDKNEIDELIMGCVGQQSDAHNVARVISLKAGIPPNVPAFTVSRNCASGLQAIVSAIQMILAGDAELVIAGGVEVMSSAPFVNRDLRFGKRLRDSQMVDTLWEGLRDPVSNLMMGETAELLAKEHGISRQEQDDFAWESHQKAVQAVRDGKFRDEIIEVPLVSRKNPKGEKFLCDEGPNPDLNREMLDGFPPVFNEKGTVTSGNACPISDGAAAVIVTTFKKAKKLGLDVFAHIRGWAFTGIEPERMGLGPVGAIDTVLNKAQMTLKTVELMEINEAFAAQFLAVERKMKWDRNCVNVNGGAIALGHPVGATGTRLVVTLVHEMKKRNVTHGLAALCIGGGQGGSLLLERK